MTEPTEASVELADQIESSLIAALTEGIFPVVARSLTAGEDVTRRFVTSYSTSLAQAVAIGDAELVARLKDRKGMIAARYGLAIDEARGELFDSIIDASLGVGLRLVAQLIGGPASNMLRALFPGKA